MPGLDEPAMSAVGTENVLASRLIHRAHDESGGVLLRTGLRARRGWPSVPRRCRVSGVNEVVQCGH